MKKFNLNDFTRGWIVGTFSPNLFHKDYEIGFGYYKIGDKEAKHYHSLSREMTVILLGKVKMNDVEYEEGDIVIQEINEATDFECLSDTAITAVYRPDGSFPNDKYFL